nr:hypothetical protein GCM10020241_62630 [Streptoalloteichus tenebrarius]
MRHTNDRKAAPPSQTGMCSGHLISLLVDLMSDEVGTCHSWRVRPRVKPGTGPAQPYLALT